MIKNISSNLSCAVCEKKFSTKYHLARHELIHSNEPEFECHTCGNKFFRKDCLRDHIKEKHTLSETGIVCELCKKRFRTKQKYTRHQRSHLVTVFDCDDCGKKFSKRAHLISHQRKHANSKDLFCSICFKSYTRRRDLQYHLDQHFEHVRPKSTNISCAKCGQSFQQKKLLLKHMRSEHKGLADYVCKLCGKDFHTKTGLFIHSNKIHGQLCK